MSPVVDTRSRTTYNQPADTVVNCSAATDSAHTKRTLRRFKKEDGVIYHIPSSSNLASLFASDESGPILEKPSTLNRKSSSASIDTTRPLQVRAVRRPLSASETVAPHKTTSQHTAKSPIASPTKPPSTKPGARKLQRSASSRVEDSAEPDIESITSRILQRFAIFQVAFDFGDVGELEPASQATVDDTPANYALEDLIMKVRCHERHVTTWDAPESAFFIFPAQLLIACTSTNDFDPLVVPDVTIAHLVCTTVAINGSNKFHRQIAFRTFYDGATIRYVNDRPTPDLSRGIHIGDVPWCSTMDGDGNFGWYMRFWIPIPFALFQRAETRAFKIDARVHVNGEDGKEGFMNSSSDFTLSRLMRGVAM
ncbi:hypothetical protein DEU56DRAFT_172830 [Suillus clintonianus]|uniref:uncharacterized protein n=1 Tax=Suillus clintonianus TaxID=1904413 RepID=UPI001B87C871|nr:uncharacterized protein DEU56DRAFT_172830 [Suillus clintonianus]KAG2116160.1 hypothetical protein DEU56DRAFT_172830 [Suillus clintonianus]